MACFFSMDEINAQKINQFDTNKKRTGVWKKYHTNKRIRYSGQFKDGKEIGVFKFYDMTTSKHPTIIKKFNEQNDSVFVQFYTIKPRLQSEGFMIRKNREGKWKYFFADGKILSEENYKNGLLDGELINFYPSGKVAEKSFYKNGLKNGVSEKFTSAGILIESVEYINDKENGKAKYFDLKGNLKESGIYKKGKRVGKWEFYLDGEIVSEKEATKKKTFQKKN